MDVLVKGYLDTIEQSKENCGSVIEKTRQFIVATNQHFYSSYCELLENKHLQRRIVDSLVDKCYLESFRIETHIMFFSCAAMYRNAFDSVRYLLESIVQTLYLDMRHPDVDICTKIAILREVEDRIEYHAVRLIDDLDIDFKDRLKKEYRKLSSIVHPSHRQIVSTLADMSKAAKAQDVFGVASVDCGEVLKIYDSVKMMCDILFYLFAVNFPEIRDLLGRNTKFINDVKMYKLPLLAMTYKVRL